MGCDAMRYDGIGLGEKSGTRCQWLESFLKKDYPHKHLVFLLNKCDLVPTWVTKRWLRALSKEYPTVALHASMKNSFGKGALITLLRQYKKLHDDKKAISCGLVGYPNVGKSSVINMLRGEKVRSIRSKFVVGDLLLLCAFSFSVPFTLHKTRSETQMWSLVGFRHTETWDCIRLSGGITDGIFRIERWSMSRPFQARQKCGSTLTSSATCSSSIVPESFTAVRKIRRQTLF